MHNWRIWQSQALHQGGESRVVRHPQHPPLRHNPRGVCSILKHLLRGTSLHPHRPHCLPLPSISLVTSSQNHHRLATSISPSLGVGCPIALGGVPRRIVGNIGHVKRSARLPSFLCQRRSPDGPQRWTKPVIGFVQALSALLLCWEVFGGVYSIRCCRKLIRVWWSVWVGL